MTDGTNENAPPATEETSDTHAPGRWAKGMPSPNPAGRPKMPKTVKEVKELVCSNPKAPPAARVAAADSLINRAWGRPAASDFEGAEQLLIKIVQFNSPQIDDDNVKVIEGEVARDDETD